MRVILSTNRFYGELGYTSAFVFGQMRAALLDAGMLEKFLYHKIPDEEEFDRRAAEEVEGCDLFVGSVGKSLHQARKAKGLGAKTLLWNLSTHSWHQLKVLGPAYARFGKSPLTQREIARVGQEYAEADHFLVLSEFAKRTFVENGIPGGRVHVAHLGVDSEKFPYGEPKTDDFTVLFTGTNMLRKGLPWLYKAWEGLGIDGRLVVHGPAAFNNPPPNVVLVPEQVPHERLVELYHGCSINVLPSLDEGFPATVLEAMSCGRPILISNVCGEADIIEDGREGFVVPSKDWKALKEKLRWCYENRDKLVEMGKNARKLAERMTWEKFRERFIEICGEAAG